MNTIEFRSCLLVGTQRVIASGVLLVVLLTVAGCGPNNAGNAENSGQARAKLTQMGKQYSPDEFVMAAGHGDEATVKLFLDAGMPLTSRIGGNDAKSMDALFAACMDKQEAIARLLLDRGADPNTIGLGGQTALAQAAALGDTAIMQLLLAKGAKVDMAGVEKLTPLSQAAANGKGEAVKLLIQKGAVVDRADDMGITPLMQAATANSTESINTLLGAAAKIDQPTKDGQTAIMFAALRGNAEAVKVLIDHHARLDLTDNKGKTAQDYATGDVVDLLKTVTK